MITVCGPKTDMMAACSITSCSPTRFGVEARRRVIGRRLCDPRAELEGSGDMQPRMDGCLTLPPPRSVRYCRRIMQLQALFPLTRAATLQTGQDAARRISSAPGARTHWDENRLAEEARLKPIAICQSIRKRHSRSVDARRLASHKEAPPFFAATKPGSSGMCLFTACFARLSTGEGMNSAVPCLGQAYLGCPRAGFHSS